MQTTRLLLKTFVMLVGLILALHSTILAQSEIALIKAGFLPTSEPEAFQKKTVTATDELQLTRKAAETVFFWTELVCDNACQQNFKPDETVIIHRWVRDYGINVVTTQMKEFSLQDLVNGNLVVHSEQEINGPGTWFVEVKLRTLDGQPLCIPAPEVRERTKESKDKDTAICKFVLRVR